MGTDTMPFILYGVDILAARFKNLCRDKEESLDIIDFEYFEDEGDAFFDTFVRVRAATPITLRIYRPSIWRIQARIPRVLHPIPQ